MLQKLRLPLLIALTICLNILMYIRAAFTIEDANLVFAECARNSGRTSAAINLAILFMLGHFGLKVIFKEENKKYIFRVLVTLFAVNHLIHFFFVSQNFKVQALEWNIFQNLHGIMIYLFIIILPIVLWSVKKLTSPLYFVTILHTLNVTYMIGITFYGRYKPVDPAYLHRIGVLIMMVAVAYVLYRVYKERSSSFITEKTV